MGQELQLPDWATKGAAQAFAVLDPNEDNLADGIEQSYGIIGYKGKVWSLRIRGQRHNIIRPDDGTPSAFLDVIILRSPKNKSKSYYPNGYEDGSQERPVCASLDGIVPDNDVRQKQSENCALCRRNEWKIQPNGKKGRECTDYKRLAVLILPTQTKPILGEALMEPVFLRVPPDSLTSVADMGDAMAKQGFHYSSYVTRITFDPNKPHPCMVFRAFQRLTDQEAPVILKLRGDALVGRITGAEVNQSAITQQTQEKTSALGLTANAEGIVLPSQGAVTVTHKNPETPTNNSTGLGDALPVTQNGFTQGAGVSIAMEKVDTGFGGATSAIQQGTAQTTGTELKAPSAQADGGAPEESDAELDARIAKLIGG